MKDYWICAGCGRRMSMEAMGWSYFSEGQQRFFCEEKCIIRHKGRV